MASIRLRCGKCRQRFSKQQGSRRIYCEACSPPRKPPVGLRDVPSAPAGDGGRGPIEARLWEDLAAVDRAETVDGLVALSVARDLDAGRVPPGQKPTVGAKLAGLRDKALEGTAPPTADRLDDLAARRAERERAAS